MMRDQIRYEEFHRRGEVGTEGLFLSLYDQGGVGFGVQADKRSVFMGSAPADSFFTGIREPFHGLILKDGDAIRYQVNTEKK